MNDIGDSTFNWVMLPESADARLLVELSSYGADLAEAQHALTAAISLRDGDRDDVAPFLVAFAAVAYCRTFFPSNVRNPLTAHIAIPDDLDGTHQLIASYRNTTIAHSQSDLATTYALGLVDTRANEVRDILGSTVSQTLPPPVVDHFLELVETAEDLLLAVTEPVRQRLLESMRGLNLAVAMADGPRPTVIDAMAAEFNPRTKRGRYPIAHPVYWSPVGPSLPS